MLSATGVINPTDVGGTELGPRLQLAELRTAARQAPALERWHGRRCRYLFPDAVQGDYVPWFQFRGGRTANAGQYQTDRGPFTNENITHDVVANITKVWGSHASKAGVYYQNSYKPQSIFASFNSNRGSARTAFDIVECKSETEERRWSTRFRSARWPRRSAPRCSSSSDRDRSSRRSSSPATPRRRSRARTCSASRSRSASIITALVYAIGKVSGCHINPAVTFALAATKRFPWREVPGYWAAQVVGAVLGALAHLGALRPDRRSTSGWARRRSTRTRRPGRSAIFAEGIGTFILMFAILGIVDSRSPGDFAGLVIGGVVVAIIMVVGPITGASLNPARAFGPELVSAIGDGATHWNQLDPRLHPARARRRRPGGRSSTTSSPTPRVVETPIEEAVTHPDPVARRDLATAATVKEEPSWQPPQHR